MQPPKGPGNFTSKISYEYADHTATLNLKEFDSNLSRMVDPWGLAYREFLQDNGFSVKNLAFNLSNVRDKHEIYLNALIRRLSYLNINNANVSFSLKSNNEDKSLFSKEELFDRPANEVVRNHISARNTGDKPGKLEKDLQVFISRKYGDIPYRKTRRRLALFGMDFYQLNDDNGLIREYPTGVFNKIIRSTNRILPTNFIDFLTFNKNGNLAVIELKIDDPKLEVISQILDYALFISAYKELIFPLIRKHLGNRHCPQNFEEKNIVCYVVNNHFHPKFSIVAKYYSPPKKNPQFELKVIVLGEELTL